jgi:hypothetical protein
MGYSKALLKQKYELIPEYAALVDRCVQRINSKAYHNVHLLSNQVLSRNPFSNHLFHNLLFQETVRYPRVQDVIRGLALYYLRSFKAFSFYLAIYIAQRFSSKRKRSEFALCDDLHIIDTFVFVDAVLRDQHYEEQYFIGLYEVLEKHNKQFVILPRFYGPLTPSKSKNVIRVLDGCGYDFITEFQLLHFSDMFRTFRFILRYPLAVLSLTAKISKDELVDDLCTVELLETIHQVTFPDFIRYLVGRRLGELAHPRMKLISWFENQVIDKNLYKGVRETAQNVFIFGCQSFIAYPAYINMHVVEAEKPFHVIPDRVLVNGKAYLKSNPNIAYKLGPSFRYRWIFSTTIDWANKTDCAVFLSYHDRFNQEIISVCANSLILSCQRIAVRPHPTNSVESLPRLPYEWYYTDKNKKELFGTLALLITSESSTAVEAAASGISAIIIASQSTFTCNPMLEAGKGEIWDLVFDAQELDTAYNRLLEYRANHLARVKDLTEFYRKECFVEPTEESMVEVFNLRCIG